MNSLVLFLFLWSQGIPVQPTQVGTITGVLKDSAGKPAVGIRVGAVPRPDSIEAVTGDTASMSSLGETDEQGRYALENVPPGRYFVAAGVLNFPTYYPGTQAMAEGRIITVAAGATVAGIDFTLRDSSGGRIIGASGGVGIGGFAIPLDIRAESGAKVPLFGGGKTTAVRLVPVAGGNVITATVTDGLLPLQPTIADYRVSVEGLPDGYTVKSMKYGSAEIKDGILKTAPAPATAPTAPAPPQAVQLPAVPTISTIFSAANGFITYLNGILPGIQAPIPQTLSIVLTRAAAPKIPGVSVTGQFAPTVKGAFLSGVSAAIFIDHSFEFLGVPPGRHALTAFSSSQKNFAASLIVGNTDVTGIELEETSALPLNARTPTPPGPAGNHAPGRLPLAAVRGKITDAETGEPLTQGDVYVVGDYWAGHPLNATGSFEFPNLLPGQYQLEVKAVGYPTFHQDFSIDEKDLELEVKSN